MGFESGRLITMDFPISAAWAQGGQAEPGGMGLLVWTLLFIALMYFILIRPQMKRAKEHRQMIEALAKGDEVVTNGGLLGRIKEIGDNFIVLEVAKDIEVKIQKHAVSATMPKGTMKTL